MLTIYPGMAAIKSRRYRSAAVRLGYKNYQAHHSDAICHLYHHICRPRLFGISIATTMLRRHSPTNAEALVFAGISRLRDFEGLEFPGCLIESSQVRGVGSAFDP